MSILEEREIRRRERERRKKHIGDMFKRYRKDFPHMTSTSICTQIGFDLGISLQAARNNVKLLGLWNYKG